MTSGVGSVLVVGTGLAGARCAETLRAEGFGGRVVVVGAEAHPPYERPSLSKELLAGAREPADVLLRPAAFWDERGIELVRSTRIGFIDPAGRTAASTSGMIFSWDALVLATGARARRFPERVPRGVHTLRSLYDSVALREVLRPGGRLAIVGAGFIGTEVASTATALGVEIVLLEAGRAPFERVLGREVGKLLAERYRVHGVDVRLGARVAGFTADRGGQLGEVVLSGGERISCDTALVGLGAVPESPSPPGLTLDDGIVTDARGRTSIPSVYACGDVARAWRPSLGKPVRIEHWANAAAQGASVARAILGREEERDEVPYFWSDQFGLRLQYVGHAEEWASAEIDSEEDSFSVTYRGGDGRLLAALLANRSSEVGAIRRELTEERLAA